MFELWDHQRLQLSAAPDDPLDVCLDGALPWVRLARVASRFLGTGSIKTEGASGIHLPGRAVLPI